MKKETTKLNNDGTCEVPISNGMNKIFLLNFLAVIVGLTSSIFFSTSAIAAIKAPTNVVATAGDRKVSISFTPSVVTAGESIVEYVAYTGGSDAIRGEYYYEGKSATSPVVVEVPNNFEYRFKVYAIGKGAQNSPDSSYSKIVIPKSGSTTTTEVPEVPSSDTPTNVAAKAGSKPGEAIITFTPPTSTFGITGYTTKSIPDGRLGVNKNSPITVGHLEKCKPYTFIVYSNKGIISKGPDSKPSKSLTIDCKTDPVVTPTVPNAPQSVVAKAGNESVTLTIVPPESDGGSPITGYHVMVSSEGLADRVANFGNTNTLIVTKLENGVEHMFKVAAVNKYGTGDYAVSNPVVPEGTGFTSDTTGNDNEEIIEVDPREISRRFQINNPLKSSSFEEFLAKILDALVLILTPILVLMLVICGFLFVKAQGNAEQLGVAKKALLGTLIGSTLVLGAHVISNLLENTFSQF
ncbi:MAG: fibronectin type III domain-containing protein [Candidatus Pacebacteria bacterium]|nr:fibronectin type III domain-containing protein [Candidatus Paceibacterota bacterium]